MIRPRLLPPRLVVPPQPRAPIAIAEASPDWQALTDLHGAALIPNSVTPALASVVHDTGTGEFTATYANTVNQSDGYNEHDRYRVPLADLFGDWDHTIHALSVYLQPTADVDWTNRPDISVGLVSGGTASGALGAACGIKGTGSGFAETSRFGSTVSTAASGSSVGSAARPWLYANFGTFGDRPFCAFAANTGSGFTVLGVPGNGDAPAAAQPWYLHLGFGKESGTTNANGLVVKWRVFVARTVCPGVPPYA